MSKDLMTVEEMAIEQKAKKNKSGYDSRIYKEKSDEHKAQVLCNDITKHMDELNRSVSRGRVNWSDFEEVKARTMDYLTSCSISETYPSVMGLAVQGYGISRQALNQYLLSHNNEVTNFIAMVKDMMADILTNASLYNNANATQVIFQLKNHFAHADNIQMDFIDNRKNINQLFIPSDEVNRKESKEELEQALKKALEKSPCLDIEDEYLPMDDLENSL